MYLIIKIGQLTFLQIPNKNNFLLSKINTKLNTKPMMDITSFQSIQQQLNQASQPLTFEKSQYLQNLKSQCLFKDNALKTAQNLIEQYQIQNQQLKIQVLRLNQKMQNYQERIQILKHQVESNSLLNTKNYQKQLFKCSNKLSTVLQKYSELQDKYHKIQKQLAKYKNYKKQVEKNMQVTTKQEQNQRKKQIQKQFKNFLKTPISKNVNNESSYKSTHKKQNLIKISENNFIDAKNIRLHDSESSMQSSVIERQQQQFHLKNKLNLNDLQKKKLLTRHQQIKKSEYNGNQYQQIQKKKQKAKMIKQNVNTFNKHLLIDEDFLKRLKILEWKLKEKDEEIMLMLRRNKEIESKYESLRKIFDNEVKTKKEQNFQTNQEKINKKKENEKGFVKNIQSKFSQSNISQAEISSIQNKEQSNEKNYKNHNLNLYVNQQVQNRQKRHSQKYKKYQQIHKQKQRMSKKSEKNEVNPKITYFHTGFNDSTDYSTWKNVYANNY